ncbi:MAG: hypothetical protein NVS3B26_26930 [Mycobacteriales bacterium]
MKVLPPVTPMCKKYRCGTPWQGPSAAVIEAASASVDRSQTYAVTDEPVRAREIAHQAALPGAAAGCPILGDPLAAHTFFLPHWPISRTTAPSSTWPPARSWTYLREMSGTVRWPAPALSHAGALDVGDLT